MLRTPPKPDSGESLPVENFGAGPNGQGLLLQAVSLALAMMVCYGAMAKTLFVKPPVAVMLTQAQLGFDLATVTATAGSMDDPDSDADDPAADLPTATPVQHLLRRGRQMVAHLPLIETYYRQTGQQLQGMASWYGPGFDGRRAADGSRYSMDAMTAAHKTLPFGTVVRVTNRRTGKSCLVRITDRGPYVGGRIIDLSKAAASSIGMLSSGVAPVTLEVLTPRTLPETATRPHPVENVES